MTSFVTSTRAAFRTALTAGAVVLTVAGASLTTTVPAEAFVRHGGGFHGGGFHGGGFHRGIVGYRGFAVRRFAYGIGYPYHGYGFRRCVIGRHFVPGLGCRLNAVYGYRPFAYGVRRFVRPAFAYGGYGHRFGRGFGRHLGGYGHGFHRAGFGGFHRGGGFGHGGHVRRR